MSTSPGRARQPGYVAQSAGMAAGGLGVGATNLRLAPVVVFQDGVGSLSYHAPVFADLPAHTEVRDVRGRACESGLQVPWGLLIQPATAGLYGLNASVGWGDSGYQRALRDAANQVGPDALLYDVRVDLQTVNVLSIWRQACLVVTASAVTRLPEGAEELGASDAAGGGAGTGEGSNAAPGAGAQARRPAQTPTSGAAGAVPVGARGPTKIEAEVIAPRPAPTSDRAATPGSGPASAPSPADLAIEPTQDPASAPRQGLPRKRVVPGQSSTGARGR